MGPIEEKQSYSPFSIIASPNNSALSASGFF